MSGLAGGEVAGGGRIDGGEKNDTAGDLSAAWDKVVGYEAGPEDTLPVEHESLYDLDDAHSDDKTTGTESQSQRDTKRDLSKTWESTEKSVSAPNADDFVKQMSSAREEAIQSGDQATADAVDLIEHRGLLNHVQQFAEATNAKGELLRPDFHELAGKIGEILNAQKREGRPRDLAKAYREARFGAQKKVTAKSDRELLGSNLDAAQYRGGNSSRGLM